MHWQYTPVQSVQPLTNYYGVHSTVHQRVADSFSTAPPPKSSLHCPRLYWLLLLWLYKLYYVLFKSRTFVLTPLVLSSNEEFAGRLVVVALADMVDEGVRAEVPVAAVAADECAADLHSA